MSIRNSFDFSGKSVVVIGASRNGIGTAAARAFHECGATVLITGVEQEPHDEVRGHFPYRKVDVTEMTQVEGLANEIERVDILVNCAGISQRGKEFIIEKFAQTLDINLVGTFRCCNAFLPKLRESRGCIVNTASMYGQFGSPRNPGYGSSKAGVRQLTQSLAIAWAEFGIRVNGVAPGFIFTEQSEVARQDEAHVQSVIRRTPAGRWGQPDDIAGAILFLASPAANFITGTTMLVDGGYSSM